MTLVVATTSCIGRIGNTWFCGGNVTKSTVELNEILKEESSMASQGLILTWNTVLPASVTQHSCRIFAFLRMPHERYFIHYRCRETHVFWMTAILKEAFLQTERPKAIFLKFNCAFGFTHPKKQLPIELEPSDKTERHPTNVAKEISISRVNTSLPPLENFVRGPFLFYTNSILDSITE